MFHLQLNLDGGKSWTKLETLALNNNNLSEVCNTDTLITQTDKTYRFSLLKSF